MTETSTPEHQPTRAQLGILLGSVLIVALCGIAYELIIASVSSYLLGNSIYQFSLTIGLFMFAMGIGSFLTKRIDGDLVSTFVLIEIAVALAGGISALLLFTVFPFYAWYKPTMYSLILLIGTLVGLEIPLLTRILSEVRSLKTSIAHVLSLDYVGALIGSISFPILLLPHLGLFRTSFVIGLLNIAVVLLTVFAFGTNLRRGRLCFVLALLVGGLLIAGLVTGEILGKYAEQRLFADTVIFRKQTPYQRIEIVRNDRNEKIELYLDGYLQFAEQDEYRYHEALVHPVMSLPGSRKSVLVLGGGDGMAAREIFKYHDVEKVDLVDIDPEVTELSRTHEQIRRLNQASLDDPRLEIHNTDAFTFVLKAPQNYDRVIIDLPDPHNEVLCKLYSREFYRAIRKCLAPGGVMVTQGTSPHRTREAYWCIARTLQDVPFKTYSYMVFLKSFGDWGFTLASANELPREFAISVPTRFLTSDVMSKAGTFSLDTQRLPGLPVNTMTQPRLFEYYNQALKH